MPEDTKAFDEWFYEQEGFGLRCERFYDDVDQAVRMSRHDVVVKWLRVAYDLGYERGRSE